MTLQYESFNCNFSSPIRFTPHVESLISLSFTFYAKLARDITLQWLAQKRHYSIIIFHTKYLNLVPRHYFFGLHRTTPHTLFQLKFDQYSFRTRPSVRDFSSRGPPRLRSAI